MNGRRIAAAGLLAALFGCTPAVDYSELRSAAEARMRRSGTGVARENATLQSLLQRPLTAESAARIALLNNRALQAAVEQAGLARANLAQVSRLPNPTAEAALRFTSGDERPELELSAMLDLTDLLLLPVRGGAARAELDAAKLEVVGTIIDLSFAARRAFYVYQAAAETLELHTTALMSLSASADAAKRLREAGNITELDYTSQRAIYEESRLALQRAELAAMDARERLNAVMGLWGRGIGWQAAVRLPAPGSSDLAPQALEASAIESSLDLALAKQRFGASARRANAARAAGWLPELKAGVSAERDEEWAVGPAVELELPLFYQGQGEVGAARSDMRRQQNLYTDVAVRVRSAARAAASRLAAAQQAVTYYQSVLLPLKQQVVDQTQLQYNAMAIGIFQLLQAKRDQVQTAAAYVEQLRDYWLARTDVEQLLAGRLGRSRSMDIAPSELGGQTAAAGEQH